MSDNRITMDALASDVAKQAAGIRAAEMVEDGMVIGLGTGSTVLFAMQNLSVKVRDGLDIAGVPTSFQAAMRARELGIPLTTLHDYPVLDLAIDGADQVDPCFRVIKGRGAAHLREKCVAAAAGCFIIVADPGKIVPVLDAAVPLEVLPFAVTPVLSALKGLSGEPVLREGRKKDGPVITDNGNMVIDCRFGPIHQPEQLEISLSTIPGVLSCGMFCGFTKKTTIIVGDVAGARILTRKKVL
ncbi:MAG: ribose-5-phosphate isomerase RpiA [Methanomicrobiales archaeon]